MLAVGIFLYRASASGHRSGFVRWRRWGPVSVLGLAVPLIMADLVRHMLQDVGVWGECGDSVAYPRVNATDPFPPSCTWSSSQYRCSVPCCVPTWEGAGWTSAQSSFFPAPGASTPQFATLSSNGSLFFPPGFDAAAQPFPVFRPPFALDAAGVRALPRGGEDEASCGAAGLNEKTGYRL